jgi:hypothetical protein
MLLLMWGCLVVVVVVVPMAYYVSSKDGLNFGSGLLQFHFLKEFLGVLLLLPASVLPPHLAHVQRICRHHILGRDSP